MKSRMILVAIAGALICAQVYATGDGTGKIVVYYSAYNLGLNPVVNIYIVKSEDQQGIALHANRYYEFVVPPGAHTLIRHGPMGSKDAIEVQAKMGETIVSVTPSTPIRQRAIFAGLSGLKTKSLSGSD